MVWMVRPDLTRRAGEIATSGQGSETWARLGESEIRIPTRSPKTRPGWGTRQMTAVSTRYILTYTRRTGRVRQVGPPLPLMQSSLPGKVRTSNPAWPRRALVL